ncbi:MAG TPA: helix-turn-helix domain-containing protein [Actinomycetospora sp.]|nr:helix-turn-helix domain-containing protein [Actinomycetospora sp.]
MAPTRDRILDAAWALVAERGVAGLTLAEVGRAAGVSRQAVYLTFENRAGLLLAMARRTDETSGFVARIAATRELPARERFLAVLHAWLAHLPTILPVARALEAATITGDEGAAVYQERMEQWRRVVGGAVSAVAAAGELRPGWTAEEATDWVWAHTHPSVDHHLRLERGWPQERVASRLVDGLRRELLRPRPPATGDGDASEGAGVLATPRPDVR